MNWRSPLSAVAISLAIGNTVSYLKTTHDLLRGDSREQIESSFPFEGSVGYDALVDAPLFYVGRHAAYQVGDFFSE